LGDVLNNNVDANWYVCGDNLTSFDHQRSVRVEPFIYTRTPTRAAMESKKSE